ncbi:MAG: cysteine desulfurase family protein [Atopococcus tabaci]|uniref:cysteine desulfurase n=1 Tax=Atopococcus tabaci TaxID=269774 RepID=A0AA43ZSH1_9LACT|nr:cysteine desulfurase family protein [Atopococcus tabaci]
MKHVYLDHAATSPVHPEVIEKMVVAMEEAYGNPSSSHSFGRQSHSYLNQSREILAHSIGASPHEIIMTSCGTESDNMAVLGTAQQRKDLGKHIISSQVEHPAVIKALHILENQGYEVTYLAVDAKGRISVEDFKSSLRDDTILVTIMYGNNEVGTTMPIREIGQYLKENKHQAYFHTDAVQAYGLVALDVKELGVDMLSVSSHKLNGPKGIGFLYLSDAVELPSLIVGGGQESGRRAGTENIPGMAGFAHAVRLTKEDQEEKRQAALDDGDYLMSGLDRIGVDYSINGEREHTIGHVLNLHLHGVDASQFIIQLDLKGIAVSAGSACSAGTVDPSPVLVAMYGADHPAITESIRFSFGLGTTQEDLDYTIQSIEKILKK